MKNHVKVYLKHFGYGETDLIPCEVCGCRAVDIHQIKPRGMGGSNTKDFIENLMAMCRRCHEKLGDRKDTLDLLIEKHSAKLGYGITEKL